MTHTQAFHSIKVHQQTNMQFTLRTTPLPGAIIIEPACFRDERGFFLESWNRRDFAAHGIAIDFVQDNHSRSVKHVLRGFHYQDMTAPMVKLVRCTLGSVLDVIVDLRIGSPTFGRWHAVELTAENMLQLLVPVGFGHAFLTLSDVAEIQYKCSAYYTPSAEGVIAWNDPDIGVDWPVTQPILSQRDQRGMRLAEYLERPAFRFEM